MPKSPEGGPDSPLPEEEPTEKPKEKAPTTSRVICAWCKKEMGSLENVPGGQDSHGICEECYVSVMKKESKKE